MKMNSRCYGCIYCQTCDKEQEQKCAKENYMLFATKDDIRLCDLMCGEPQKDED